MVGALGWLPWQGAAACSVRALSPPFPALSRQFSADAEKVGPLLEALRYFDLTYYSTGRLEKVGDPGCYSYRASPPEEALPNPTPPPPKASPWTLLG